MRWDGGDVRTRAVAGVGALLVELTPVAPEMDDREVVAAEREPQRARALQQFGGASGVAPGCVLLEELFRIPSGHLTGRDEPELHAR